MPDTPKFTLVEGLDPTANPGAPAAAPVHRPLKAESPLARSVPDEAPTPASPVAAAYQAVGSLLSSQEYATLAQDPARLNAELTARWQRHEAEIADQRQNADNFAAILSNPRLRALLLAEMDAQQNGAAPQTRQVAPGAAPAPQSAPAQGDDRVAAVERQLAQIANVLAYNDMSRRFPDFPEVAAEVVKVCNQRGLGLEDGYVRYKWEQSQRNVAAAPGAPAPSTERVTASVPSGPAQAQGDEGAAIRAAVSKLNLRRTDDQYREAFRMVAARQGLKLG